MLHETRIAPGFFRALRKNQMRFVIRRYDKSYKVGDFIIFREYSCGQYSGRKARRRIRYIFIGNGTQGLASGLCVLGL